MWSGKYWREAAERAIKTAAQFALVAIGGDFVNAWELDPKLVAGAAVAGAVTSVLTSLASRPFGPADSPSVVE